MKKHNMHRTLQQWRDLNPTGEANETNLINLQAAISDIEGQAVAIHYLRDSIAASVNTIKDLLSIYEDANDIKDEMDLLAHLQDILRMTEHLDTPKQARPQS